MLVCVPHLAGGADTLLGHAARAASVRQVEVAGWRGSRGQGAGMGEKWQVPGARLRTRAPCGALEGAGRARRTLGRSIMAAFAPVTLAS